MEISHYFTYDPTLTAKNVGNRRVKSFSCKRTPTKVSSLQSRLVGVQLQPTVEEC